MARWNYSIIFHDDGEPDHQWYGLHEVYYDDADEVDRVTSWTRDAVSFVAHLEEGSEGIVESLRMALNDAKNRPVLSLSALRRREA